MAFLCLFGLTARRDLAGYVVRHQCITTRLIRLARIGLDFLAQRGPDTHARLQVVLVKLAVPHVENERGVRIDERSLMPSDETRSVPESQDGLKHLAERLVRPERSAGRHVDKTSGLAGAICRSARAHEQPVGP